MSYSAHHTDVADPIIQFNTTKIKIKNKKKCAGWDHHKTKKKNIDTYT